jgi:AcrR family transcriptional regulator
MSDVAGSLREKQKRLTRELILGAAADEIVEKGIGQLSLQDVAERAGVSNKTLYNHFDNRETLLGELGRWADELTSERGGPVDLPDDLRALAAVIPAAWRSWEMLGTVFEALVQIWASEGVEQIEYYADDERRHSLAVRAAVSSVRPDLADDQVAAIGGLIRTLGNPDVWRRMTTRYGATTERGGQAVAWAVGLICDALESGDDPFGDG